MAPITSSVRRVCITRVSMSLISGKREYHRDPGHFPNSNKQLDSIILPNILYTFPLLGRQGECPVQITVPQPQIDKSIA